LFANFENAAEVGTTFNININGAIRTLIKGG